jgi:hypothetical protein
MCRLLWLTGSPVVTERLFHLAGAIQRLQPVRIWLDADDAIALRGECREICPAVLYARTIRLADVPVTLMHYGGQSRMVLDDGSSVPWSAVWG